MNELDPLFGRSNSGNTIPIEFKVFPKTSDARWMLESRYRRPWHLKTWPRANFRACVIYQTAWFLSRIGIHMPSRSQRVIASEGSVYLQLREEFDHLAIFLGTPGPNRKIVMYAERADESLFLKIPIGPTSFALVQNETVALKELAEDQDMARLVPAHSLVAGHLAVENVEFGGTGYKPLGISELARVNDLMERRNHFFEPLSLIRARLEIPLNKPPAPHDGETRRQIEDVRLAAQGFWDLLPQDMSIFCYKAHGDFTRWNVLRAADGTARIIDWELYGTKPRYFDLVHYFVSHDILVRRKVPAQILAQLEKLGTEIGNPELWWQHVGHYFAFQAIYYASVYERQQNLHVQVRPQVRAWTEILQQLTSRLKNAGTMAEG